MSEENRLYKDLRKLLNREVKETPREFGIRLADEAIAKLDNIKLIKNIAKVFIVIGHTQYETDSILAVVGSEKEANETIQHYRETSIRSYEDYSFEEWEIGEKRDLSK